MVGAALTSPVNFVTIPKTEKEIVFKETANVRTCKATILHLSEEEIKLPVNIHYTMPYSNLLLFIIFISSVSISKSFFLIL